MNILSGLSGIEVDEKFLSEDMENTIQKLYSLEKDIDEILERNSVDNPEWISLEQYSAEGIGDAIKERFKKFTNTMSDVFGKISDRSSDFVDLFKSNDKILNDIISEMKGKKFNEAKFKELKANILTIKEINYLSQGIRDLDKGSFEEIPDYRAVVKKAINTVNKYTKADRKTITSLSYTIALEFTKWCERLPKFNLNVHGIEVKKNKDKKYEIKSDTPLIIKNKKIVKLVDAKFSSGNIVHNLGVSLRNIKPLNSNTIFEREIKAEFKYFEKFMNDLIHTSIIKGRIDSDGFIFFR